MSNTNNAIDRIHNALNGAEYPLREKEYGEIFNYAKEHGIVIVFGASDDLVEFYGAICDEVGAYEGTIIAIDAEGIIPEFEDIDRDDREALKAYFRREGKGRKIEAVWCPEDENGTILSSWAYKTDLPHKTFNIMEDGEIYCVGIIFEFGAIANQNRASEKP